MPRPDHQPPQRLLPRSGALLLAFLAVAATGTPAAQGPSPQETTFAAVPFAPGEKASYVVRLGGVGVGRGSMEIVGMETVRGNPTYHARLRVSGGIPLARVDDRFDSWIDARDLFSRRFKQDQKEIRFRRLRTYDFFPETYTFRRDNGDVGTIPTNRPLDDVSFLYYARTLPLRVGETYSVERYFKADGNPVVIRVLRRETIRVPAGRFNTVVVRPIIKTDGLFGEGGEAEVFFTDDDRRIMVQMRSKVPLIGSLTLHMDGYTPGEPYRQAPAR